MVKIWQVYRDNPVVWSQDVDQAGRAGKYCSFLCTRQEKMNRLRCGVLPLPFDQQARLVILYCKIGRMQESGHEEKQWRTVSTCTVADTYYYRTLSSPPWVTARRYGLDVHVLERGRPSANREENQSPRACTRDGWQIWPGALQSYRFARGVPTHHV